MSPAPAVAAVRDLLAATVADHSLSDAVRLRSIRELRDDLSSLMGQADLYLGDSELAREAGTINQQAAVAEARENADLREEAIRRGLATAEQMDGLGFFSHERLDAMADDGTLHEALEEAFGGVRVDPAKLAAIAKRRRRSGGGQFADEFSHGPPKAKGRGGRALPGGVKAPGARHVPGTLVPRVGPVVSGPGGITPGKDGWHDVGSDVHAAADLLSQGHKVRLNQKREASVLLGELAKRVQEAKAKGDAAPNFDLCKVTVKDTNLFCAESKGIKRVNMPQLSGQPTPGSPADKLPKDKAGNVDLAPAFRAHLESMGHTVTDTTEKASHLKASQVELNGAKVAGMVKHLEGGGTLGDAPIFTSSDNYIVDGHHRWGAHVGHDLADGKGGNIDMQVSKVNVGITELLHHANEFTKAQGIAGKDINAPGSHDALPENGDAYFNTDEKALKAKYGPNITVADVPLDSIKPIRARPEGIANAKPHMANAAAGKGAKRDPITLVKQPDGSHKVYDGNSTFAIAKEAGWKSIPAIVVNSDEEAAAIETKAKADKAATKAKAAKPAAATKPAPGAPAKPGEPAAAQGSTEEQDAALKAMFQPAEQDKPTQSFESLDAIYTAAAAAKPEYDDTMTAVGEALGAHVPDFKAAMKNAAEDPGTPQVLLAPLKGRERAQEKIDTNYDGDHNRLIDVVRGTILMPTVADVPAALAAVREHFTAKGWTLANAKDRHSMDGPPPPSVEGPTSAGYGDSGISLVSPSGVVTELQFNTPAMFLAKEGDGHKLYEEWRKIKAQVKARQKASSTSGAPASPGGPTRAEAKRMAELETQQQAIYGAARKAAYGG